VPQNLLEREAELGALEALISGDSGWGWLLAIEGPHGIDDGLCRIDCHTRLVTLLRAGVPGEGSRLDEYPARAVGRKSDRSRRVLRSRIRGNCPSPCRRPRPGRHRRPTRRRRRSVLGGGNVSGHEAAQPPCDRWRDQRHAARGRRPGQHRQGGDRRRATESSPVGNEHGWRLGRIIDPFCHEWEIGTPLGAWPPS